MGKKPSIAECPLGFAFDDVLLLPAASSVLPQEASTSLSLFGDLTLHIPFLSSAMDTVTEADMAIAMAQAGGLGVVHKNFSSTLQAKEVRKVKKFEAGMVINPVVINPDDTLDKALTLMREHNISGIPVVAPRTHRLEGIITNRDVRFVDDRKVLVRRLMTANGLITIEENPSKKKARQLFHQHRIEKLIVVDKEYRCRGLITVKDMEKEESYPLSTKDKKGRLCVGAAVENGTASVVRAQKLVEMEVDFIVLDTAHGHSMSVLETVKALRKAYKNLPIVGGNVATAAGARALIEAGVHAVKVGMGPGSICTTRIVSGVGVPQLTAIEECASICAQHCVPLIADGGIRYSGDVPKAIAAGANCVMLGSLLAGTKQAPGETILYQGRTYKAYRGMGSLASMRKGGVNRYFQENTVKLVPEGVEGRIPYRGETADILYQLVGGLKAAMGYTGCRNLKEMREKASFLRLTQAALRESHVHSVSMMQSAPNYDSTESKE